MRLPEVHREHSPLVKGKEDSSVPGFLGEELKAIPQEAKALRDLILWGLKKKLVEERDVEQAGSGRLPYVIAGITKSVKSVADYFRFAGGENEAQWKKDFAAELEGSRNFFGADSEDNFYKACAWARDMLVANGLAVESKQVGGSTIHVLPQQKIDSPETPQEILYAGVSRLNQERIRGVSEEDNQKWYAENATMIREGIAAFITAERVRQRADDHN